MSGETAETPEVCRRPSTKRIGKWMELRNWEKNQTELNRNAMHGAQRLIAARMRGNLYFTCPPHLEAETFRCRFTLRMILLVMLACKVRKHPFLHASHAQLALLLGCHQRTVFTAQEEAVSRGWIEKVALFEEAPFAGYKGRGDEDDRELQHKQLPNAFRPAFLLERAWRNWDAWQAYYSGEGPPPPYHADPPAPSGPDQQDRFFADPTPDLHRQIQRRPHRQRPVDKPLGLGGRRGSTEGGIVPGPATAGPGTTPQGGPAGAVPTPVGDDRAVGLAAKSQNQGDPADPDGDLEAFRQLIRDMARDRSAAKAQRAASQQEPRDEANRAPPADPSPGATTAADRTPVLQQDLAATPAAVHHPDLVQLGPGATTAADRTPVPAAAGRPIAPRLAIRGAKGEDGHGSNDTSALRNTHGRVLRNVSAVAGAAAPDGQRSTQSRKPFIRRFDHDGRLPPWYLGELRASCGRPAEIRDLIERGQLWLDLTEAGHDEQAVSAAVEALRAEQRRRP